MTNELDTKLSQLKKLEGEIESLSILKETIRKELFEIIESENIGQYKNEIATISKVERKTVKFIKDKDLILQELEDKQLVKYVEYIPEEIIPEHKEFTKDFDKDIKDGKFTVEGVEVEVKTNPMIRFNK